MWLTRLSIARPLAVFAIFLAVAVAGLVAYLSLPINLFPNINIPVVTVTTAYPGAGPEEVELQVTANIEDAVAGLSDIDNITSTSSEGISSVIITFTDRANNDLIGSTVERQVDAAIGTLPADAQRPIVTKLDPNALPVMQIAVVGDRLAPEDLFNLADQTLRPQFERLTGVSQVGVLGGRQQEVRVAVDPQKMAAAGVSLTQVQTALAAANVTTPGGSVSERGTQYSLRVVGQFARPEDFARVVVGGTSDNPVRLGDIATVGLGAADQTQITRVNGHQGVLLRIGQQNGANTTDVADAVQAALPGIRAQLPAGAELIVVQDSSQFVRTSIGGVRSELISAVMLTAVVLFLFLHNPRIAFIVLLSIPTTLLGALVAMDLMGFSLNFLSMLGLTLSIGILVDDSIVILESILRRLEVGDPPVAAALHGRASIGLAALAITLVDVVVFAPVGLVRGQVGGFFREFGFTIAATTLLSLLVSFTLTPLLASRLARLVEGRGPIARFANWWDRGFERLEQRYQRILHWSLHHRLPTLLLASLSLVFGVALIATGQVGTEFFPQNDQGFISVSTQAPPGTSLDAHDAAMRQVEQRLLQIPEVQSITATVGAAATGFGGGGGQTRNGTVTVQLKPKPRRSAFDVAADARQRLADVPGVKIQVDVEGAGGAAQPVQLRLQGPDETTLAQLGDQVIGQLKTIPGLRDFSNSAAVGLPEIRIAVDRPRADDLGITPQTLGAAVRTAYGGVVATKYRKPDGKDLDVRLILAQAARLNVGSVGDLPLQTSGGQTVRLREVATISQVAGPTQIDRRNQQRVVTVGANLEEGVALGNVTPRINAAVKQVQLPPGYTIAQGGNAEQQSTAFLQLGLALVSSILLAYLLMAVLYDSLVYPLVILFALPVAVGGAIGGLWVFHYALSIFAMIGMILLVAVAIKNGILLVDRTNHNRKERGMAREAALLEAGPVRLRPILMTSLTIAMALTPTALGLGEGAELRAPLAAAVLGGVISSTLLTLVVVPVTYTLLDSLQVRVARLIGWHAGAPAPAPAPTPPEPMPIAGGEDE